jgi:signal transduction histidine kinase
LFIRPKLFLTFLGLCLVPLVLLASINYWYSLRIAKATLQQDQETSLAKLGAEIGETLRREQDELNNLSRSKPLLDYVRSRGDGNTAYASQLTRESEAGALNTLPYASSTLPTELRVRLASVLNSRAHLKAISLFDRNKHRLFQAQQQAGNGDEPVAFSTEDLLSGQPQPDDRVWTEQLLPASGAATIFNSPISMAQFGSYTDCTVPVFSKQNVNTPQEALVGQLRLDSVFSDAAKGIMPTHTTSSTYGFESIPSMFTVVDRSGRFLYNSNAALKYQLVSDSMPSFLPVSTQMFASESGKTNFRSTSGDMYSASYARIPILDVSVAAASNQDQALASARQAGRTGFVVAVLLGLIAAALLTRQWQRHARGLERVTEGVEAIAKGKLDHRIELQSSDDLRPLADNLGLMTKQLRDQIARETETRQFQSFVRLSAILTHDLKNAIGALSLTVTNIERHFDNKDFRADAMKSLTGATDNLRAVVARLSNPVTTLSGEHKRPQPVDLVPMLKRATSLIAEPAREQHEIRIDLPESLFALVDIERMNKVVENLIINALEAMSQKKGTLDIAAGTTDDGKPFFSVGDTGEGMGQRFIEEKLFRPFATTKRRGVGLGLYTCREVVVANGGSIAVDSQEGVGTTFRVVLPSVAIDKGGEQKPRSKSHS